MTGLVFILAQVSFLLLWKYGNQRARKGTVDSNFSFLPTSPLGSVKSKMTAIWKYHIDG